jgi:hypothetical protein
VKPCAARFAAMVGEESCSHCRHKRDADFSAMLRDGKFV